MNIQRKRHNRVFQDTSLGQPSVAAVVNRVVTVFVLTQQTIKYFMQFNLHTFTAEILYDPDFQRRFYIPVTSRQLNVTAPRSQFLHQIEHKLKPVI